jgi:hypothetical protein
MSESAKEWIASLAQAGVGACGEEKEGPEDVAKRIAVACAQHAYTSLEVIAWEDAKVLLALPGMEDLAPEVRDAFEKAHSRLKVLHVLVVSLFLTLCRDSQRDVQQGHDLPVTSDDELSICVKAFLSANGDVSDTRARIQLRSAKAGISAPHFRVYIYIYIYIYITPAYIQ